MVVPSLRGRHKQGAPEETSQCEGAQRDGMGWGCEWQEMRPSRNWGCSYVRPVGQGKEGGSGAESRGRRKSGLISTLTLPALRKESEAG